jgi:hypothetical protein
MYLLCWYRTYIVAKKDGSYHKNIDNKKQVCAAKFFLFVISLHVLCSDIWMNIQEEGHAPSDTLKAEMARCLVAGGLDVPFVYTENIVKTRRAEKSAETVAVSTEGKTKESRRQRPAEEARATVRDSRKEPVTLGLTADSVIAQAIKNGDLNAVAEAIEKNYAQESAEAIR